MKAALTKILLAACLPLSASLALATDYNFQSQTAGAATSGSGITVFGSVIIAGSGTTPVDAFGGTGNQSLYISSSTGSTNQAQLSLSSTPLTTGTLTFDLYVVGTGTTPGLIEIDLGVLGTTSVSQRPNSLVALQIWTNATTTTDSSHTAPGQLFGFIGGTVGSGVGSNLYAFNQTALIGAKNTVSISWDANANTYSIMLNGVTVTQGTGSSIVSTFAQATEQSGVTDVRFTTSNASSTSYFIDNVSLSAIPEPSTTAGLAGVAAGLIALCGRRAGAKRLRNINPEE